MNPLVEVKNLLEKKLPGSLVEVSDMTGTMDHLDLIVTWQNFKGLSLLKQHQLVMDALRESLQEQVHAVKIKTIIPNTNN